MNFILNSEWIKLIIEASCFNITRINYTKTLFHRSFCDSHRPRQNYLESMIGRTVECAICGDNIVVDSKVVPREVLVTECCNMTPLHRECIQNQADASGYFFRCPMCNNEKKFNSIMKIMGINIPQRFVVHDNHFMILVPHLSLTGVNC